MENKSYIRITKEFKFEMGHALKGYDGPCRNIHGHSYGLKVTIAGEPSMNESDPKLGMVMDFGDLKEIVRKAVISEFDHALVLSKEMPEALLSELKSNFQKIILVDYQPTSEMMIQDFALRIKRLLPDNVELVHLLLRETVTSYAEWFAHENK
jgi:6-pyruvoyltetrahydropterin/6-carboxytetrahydropterin synthase